MLRFRKTKTATEKFFAAKKPIKIWDVNVDNIVISKLIEIKTNSKYLIMPKMNGYVKISKAKEENKDKDNKLISSHIDNEKLLEKYKAI